MTLRIAQDVEPHELGDWYCTCKDVRGRKPHVHCPWGGMHVHLVDIETGEILT